jgi:hypothetical protein
MSETEYAHDGTCPRCDGADIEREVIRQTTAEVVSGVVFFCNTCGLTDRALSSDRERWYDAHRQWHSPAVPEETLAAFLAKWPKKVGNPSYGSPEPLGPILPVVKK